jgi:hypothetical protein
MPGTHDVVDENGRWRVTTHPSGAESRALIEPSQEHLDAREAERQEELVRRAEEAARQALLDRERLAEKASVAAVRSLLAPKVRAEELTAAELEEAALVFRAWAPGQEVEVGAVREYEGGVYEAIQAHTTQEDWTPTETPALWKSHRPAGEVSAWVQPTGAHDAYDLGARVTHGGQEWISTVDANVWEPGVFGWDPVT